MRRVLSLVDLVSVWTGRFASIFSLVCAFVIAYEIVLRQLFLKPTVWAAEATVFACAILYLLGGPWTLLEDKHVRVDALYRKLQPKTRALVDCLTYLPFCLYLLVMIWATYNYVADSIKVGETTMSPWNPPIWPVKLLMLISLVMIFLQGTAKFVRDICRVTKGTEP